MLNPSFSIERLVVLRSNERWIDVKDLPFDLFFNDESANKRKFEYRSRLGRARRGPKFETIPSDQYAHNCKAFSSLTRIGRGLLCFIRCTQTCASKPGIGPFSSLFLK
jgi:hypothetical protein